MPQLTPRGRSASSFILVPKAARRSGLLAALILSVAGGSAQPAARAQAPVNVDGGVQRVDNSPNNPNRRPNDGRRRGEIDLSEIDLVSRTIDGVANNLENPEWGASLATMLRLAAADYADGSEDPAGGNRPSARAISNAVIAQDEDIPNSVGASDFLWQWGQFLDHDLDLTPIAEPVEHFDIPVPTGDLWFDPTASGVVVIPLERSSYDDSSGVRQQFNELTSYIDASNVYGSDAERAAALRTFDGTGKLRTSDGDLLPYNTAGLPNAPNNDAAFFLAGDLRANEQVVLSAMHTLFVREHNFWAGELAAANPDLDGDDLYGYARTIVGAEMQAITYREFLPVLLGRGAMGPYRGYDAAVNPGIANEFATAAYRVGHTMLSSEILRLAADGSAIEQGPLALADAFFSPELLEEHGIEPLLRGLAAQQAQEIDLHLIDAVRNLLFGPPGSGGFDLASLNIQRGRDHGLADYNTTRVALGLPRVEDFTDITPDPEVSATLRDLYGSVDDVDLWVGGLAEPHARGALVGPTFRAILVDQFQRLREGDRFWYQAALPTDMVRLIEEQTLDSIIRRNTTIGRELSGNVFYVDRERPRRP